jgi:CHAT domain-containing protein
LESCAFLNGGDGYSGLPKSIPGNRGYSVIYESYLELYRNLSKNDLLSRVMDRDQFITALGGKKGSESFLDDPGGPVDEQEIRSWLKTFGDKFSPIGSRVRDGLKLAHYFAAREKWDDALGFLAGAMKLAESQARFPVLDELEQVRGYYLLFKGFNAKGGYEDAVKYLQRAIKLLEKVRERYETERQRAFFFTHLEKLIDQKMLFYLERKQLGHALQSLDERKNRTLKEMMDRLRFEVDTSTETAEAVAVSPASGNDGTRGQKRAGMEAYLRWDAPEIPSDRNIDVLVDRDAISGGLLGLAEDELALVFSVAKEQVLVWVMHPEKPIFTVRIQVTSGAIKLAHDHFLDRMNEGLGNEKSNRDALIFLHQLILDPVFQAMDDQGIADLQRFDLILIPFGLLNNLPIHAFYDKHSERYVFQRFKGLVYAPSYEIYQKNKSKKLVRPYSVLAIGISEFQTMNNLKATVPEAQGIHDLHPGSSMLLLNQKAVKSNVMAGLTEADVVHFATHATFFMAKPSASTIFLYGDAQPEANLRAFELAGRDLSGKLFVLSACETGFQDVAPGDDLFGLERYLLAGGAVGVVSSFWQVSDRTTADYMRTFYQQLAAGATPSDAYFAALKQIFRKEPDPRLWAPFKITAFQ